MEHHCKNKSGHVGTRTCVAGLSQQTCYALDHHTSPKKDASSPESFHNFPRVHPFSGMYDDREHSMSVD